MMRKLAILGLVTLLGSGCGDDDGGTNGADAGMNNDARPCTNACNTEGEATCDVTGHGRYVCVRATTGCLAREFELCPDDGVCEDGVCLPCEGQSGIFQNRQLEVDTETRYYYLYVPPGYDCADPWPLLVDLHGSGSGARPEEAYGLAGALATADGSGFILVRPRSRSSMEGPTEVFRWDQNPGDPELNRVFIRSLVEHLATRYHLDPDRQYVMGFSSGTNQTAVAAADADTPFSGYAFIGGGEWTVDSGLDSDARYYLNTGFRDYMRTYHRSLVDLITSETIQPSLLFFRKTDAGHELYAWMYPELWAWLDEGHKPPTGSLQPGWTLETTTGTAWSLLALARASDGALVATGENETLLRRDPGGTWTDVAASGTAAFPGRDFTGICLTQDGTGIAVGGGMVARSTDSGATWSHRPAIPDFGTVPMGYSHLNGVDCEAGRIVGNGYWVGATSTNGTSWTPVSFDNGGITAQGAAIRHAPWGTWMAVGYFDYAARSTDGTTFAAITYSPSVEWVLDVAPVTTDTWVMVGEAGHIWRSTDDGLHFAAAQTSGPDLYAVSFFDNLTGLTVGLGGAALLTEDGGATWIDCSTGLDRFLGDVAWLPDGTAIVVGEAGLVLHLDPDGC